MKPDFYANVAHYLKKYMEGDEDFEQALKDAGKLLEFAKTDLKGKARIIWELILAKKLPSI